MTQTETGTITEAPADVPPMWFVVPQGFHALPIAANEEERARKAREMVRELYPEGEEALWEPAARYYAAVGEAVSDRVLPTRPEFCEMTVTIMRTVSFDAADAAGADGGDTGDGVVVGAGEAA